MFKFDVLEIDDFVIKKKEIKIFYNSDDKKSLTDWLNIGTNNNGKIEVPNLSSPLNIKNKSNRKTTQSSLGWFSCGTNTVERNTIDVGIMTSPYSHKGTSGFNIENSNIFKCLMSFSCRKTINSTWKNKKDYYFEPNESHEQFNQFKYDSIVYSLFNSASNQSSLRQVTYKDKLWDIKNEFFWMSKEEMMELANNNNYYVLYSDARTENNRYVHNLLFGEENIYEQLSPDAKLVLDKATELVRMSMTTRSHFADDQNHLNSWDAGYAQLKLVWKEYFPNEFKEFRQLYKNLEDRMRPLVYELGFLLK
jgi:hypothetical protein